MEQENLLSDSPIFYYTIIERVISENVSKEISRIDFKSSRKSLMDIKIEALGYYDQKLKRSDYWYMLGITPTTNRETVELVLVLVKESQYKRNEYEVKNNINKPNQRNIDIENRILEGKTDEEVIKIHIETNIDVPDPENIVLLPLLNPEPEPPIIIDQFVEDINLIDLKSASKAWLNDIINNHQQYSPSFIAEVNEEIKLRLAKEDEILKRNMFVPPSELPETNSINKYKIAFWVLLSILLLAVSLLLAKYTAFLNYRLVIEWVYNSYIVGMPHFKKCYCRLNV